MIFIKKIDKNFNRSHMMYATWEREKNMTQKENYDSGSEHISSSEHISKEFNSNTDGHISDSGEYNSSSDLEYSCGCECRHNLRSLQHVVDNHMEFKGSQTLSFQEIRKLCLTDVQKFEKEYPNGLSDLLSHECAKKLVSDLLACQCCQRHQQRRPRLSISN
jgi:hypothetical protein